MASTAEGGGHSHRLAGLVWLGGMGFDVLLDVFLFAAPCGRGRLDDSSSLGLIMAPWAEV